MSFIKTALFTLFAVNILGISFMAVYQFSKNESHLSNKLKTDLITKVDEKEYHKILRELKKFPVREKRPSRYSFDDPTAAYFILDKLDIFEPVPASLVPGADYKFTGGCFKVNRNYCKEHRARIVEYPEVIFEERNFETNFATTHKLRTQVIPQIGVDIHPEHIPYLGRYPTKSDLNPDVNMFYTENFPYRNKQIGVQMSCLSQESNHIPGHDQMYRKDFVSQAIVEYGRKYENRTQCFNFNKYFLKNWVLTDKKQCLDFFEEFNGKKCQQLKKERNVVYFRKVGAFVHQGQGVAPVTNDEEKELRELYQNGALCGEVDKNYIIQYNVWNSLLVKKRKPGMRVFMLVASTDPLIAYYHDGYVRLSLNEYDVNAQDKGTFVTNIHVNVKEAHDGSNPFANMTHQEIDDYTCWMNSQFHEYLMEQGLVKDPNWLDNYFRAELKKIMIHLLRMSQHSFVKRSSIFELYGLDFVMDEHLNLWFIECNCAPLIDGFTNDTTKLMNQMLLDVFDIQFALLRSRMKRVVLYVNRLTQKYGGAYFPDLETKREEFRELIRNYYDPEFQPRTNNTFQLIINENKNGAERYAGLMKEECLKI